jgi:hypothetical protein
MRPELEVRNRRSFRDLSASSELDYAVEAALLGGGAGDTGEKLSASLGPTKRDGARRVQVPLKISIPARINSGAATSKISNSRALELRIAAVDQEGRRTLVGPVPIATPTRDEAVGFLDLIIPLRLRRASQNLVVSLHDPSDGSVWIAHLRLEP